MSSRPKRNPGGIRDRARNLAIDANSVARSRTLPAENVLKAALTNNALALTLYNNLIDLTSPNTALYKSILKETREALADSQKIQNKLRAAKELPGSSVAELASSVERLSFDQPKIDNRFSGIVTSTPEDAALVKKIIDTIITKPCGLRTFDDYAGSAEFKEFFDIIAKDRFTYDQFRGAHPSNDSILLFGPPGTGKTLLAEAVAAELAPLGGSFISISSSDILGRFVGESGKSLKYLFAVARELTKNGPNGKYGDKPVVVFMDEIDGLISEGGSSSGGGTDLLSEFNAQAQGLKGTSNKGLIVLAATNYPDRMPAAAFQRFSQRIFVGLPSLDDVRQILMNKLRKMGWDRVNFSESKNIDWLQTIDWERNKFITTFLNIDQKSDLIGWSYPGQFDKFDDEGNLTNSVSFFTKKAESNDLNPNRDTRQILPPTELDEIFFDVTAGGRENSIPWDAVDFMAWILFNKYYAPREIDSLFNQMLFRAEQRSVIFATSNPGSESKVYYQKWLLEKALISTETDEGNQCVPQQETRYSFIPLWYTVGDEGENGRFEKAFLEKFKDVPEVGKFGEIWGYKKSTSSNGDFTVKLHPKFDLKDKNNDIRIIVARAEITNIFPVAQVLKQGKDSIPIRKYYIERRQKDTDIYQTLETNPNLSKENAPFIPTEKWVPSANEKLDPDNLPRVLGISQITLTDFLAALTQIKSIVIRNVDVMLEYADKYGRSLKKGEDILQLKRQAEIISRDQQNSRPETSRYSEIWTQFIDALQQTGIA